MWQKLFLTVEIIDSVTMVFQPHTAPTTIAPSANEYLKKKCGAGGGNNTACYILTRHVIYVLLYHPFYFCCLPWIIHFVCNADVSTHTGTHTHGHVARRTSVCLNFMKKFTSRPFTFITCTHNAASLQFRCIFNSK